MSVLTNLPTGWQTEQTEMAGNVLGDCGLVDCADVSEDDIEY